MPYRRSRIFAHYIPMEDGHFQLHAYVQVDGEWKRWNTQDCRRLEG